MALYGAMGKVLRVDLTTGEIVEERPSAEVYETYLGGYGLGAYVLFKHQKPKVDPMGPDNLLGFCTGVLTDTPALAGNRYQVVGKSPKTGTWGDANSGGYFGPGLKRAGVDAVFFSGCASEPVCLIVENGAGRLEPADGLWGLDSNETDDRLREQFGKDAGIACIGPVGERAQLLACVMNDKGRAAGRSGLGAVMGAKRIKAIVARGDQETPLADPERMTRLRKKAMDILHAPDNVGFQSMSRYGTPAGTGNSIRTGDTPIKNWAGIPEEMPNPDHLGGDHVIQYQERRFACSKCPIGCGGEMKIDEGPYAVEGTHKPEYETLGSFGAMMLNDSVESVTLLNDICNRAGMDTISAGCTVAFAMECYDRGILSRDDLGGLDLTWGNHEAIVALTRQIANNEGFGAVLADGIKVAVERIGPDAGVAAMHAHGEELPMHDPRLFPGLSVSYRGDATPGRHTQASAWFHEVNAAPADLEEFYPVYEDKYNPRGKAPVHWALSNFGHVVNAAGVCLFGANQLPAGMMAEFLSATLGKEITLEDLLHLGARIATLRTAFNVREGHSPLKVKLPARVEGRPPLPGGPLRGVTLDTDTEVKEYLVAMGWDETGKPKKETLEKMGLDFVVGELYPS